MSAISFLADGDSVEGVKTSTSASAVSQILYIPNKCRKAICKTNQLSERLQAMNQVSFISAQR